MTFLRQWLRRPSVGARAVAAMVTAAALIPALLRLPKVAVVACFESGHPLYQWVPTTEFTGAVHCVSAPTAIVSWTLMITATLVVQLLLLPLVLTAATVLVRGAVRLARSAGQLLAAALLHLSSLVVIEWRPAPIPVPVRRQSAGYSRTNPRRGPPSCLS